jgi:hypothetical protein
VMLFSSMEQKGKIKGNFHLNMFLLSLSEALSF